MLTISKPLSAGQAQTYHQKDFTAKEQNYWSQRGVIAGEWQGRLAAQFGLAGAVSAEDFAKLSQGQHPQTGEQLVRQRTSYEYQDAEGKTVTTMEHRAGWDATFSAPKSVSLTALVGGAERVREAHRESVRVALDQFEHYAQARIGGERSLTRSRHTQSERRVSQGLGGVRQAARGNYPGQRLGYSSAITAVCALMSARTDPCGGDQ